MAEFAHLHLHTDFSLLDGMGRINDYITSAQQMGMHHMAVTDHGVMYGSMDWYKAATKAGMHPILGMEAYLAQGSAKESNRSNYHLLLLAENEVGYHNLIRLASEAALNGFYYRPRVDLEMLQQYGTGIIATSACVSGPLARNFLNNQPEKAYDLASSLSDIFGKDRFYVEIQDHGLSDQHVTNKQMIELARAMDLPLLLTNDVHYCYQGDASAQEILLCVGTNTTMSDPKRLKQDTDEFYLKSPDEMALLFPELPEAMANSMRIAEMCNVKLDFDGYHLPDFETPEGLSSEQYLRQLCEAGLQERYGTVEGKVRERLEYELGIIATMGFTNYFLIVWDFVSFAKRNGILVGPGRGSAASSIVTYGLGITGLDPLEHNLMFERFLNPSRISMPDIDIDFDHDRRDEVINYVVEKYGEDRVAGIGTFGTLRAKAAIKDCARAMDYTIGEANRVAGLIPTDPKATIDKALKEVPEFRAAYDQEERVRNLVDTARRVEGLNRNPGRHAAGVVISRDPLVEHVPLTRSGKGRTDVTTQWTQGHLEDLGLLKMDFLGLKTLSVVGRAVELARAAGSDITIETIPMNDEETLEMLRRGDTFGVFQLESGMSRGMTIDVAPTSFDDIIALNALIRPGPMDLAPLFCDRKHGRQDIEYPHPLLEDVLKETYGVALYQEQVMLIANVLAGFSMAEADALRKAMGKKLPEVMAEKKDQFIQGALANDVPEEAANSVWELIEKFAGYGFVKSHSAAYGVISAQTAYLKAHFRPQFMAALMTTEIDSSEKTVTNVSECIKAGIAVLPPDVNRSAVDFTVEIQPDGSEAVRFGLGAIKGVGRAALESLIQSRSESENGAFTTIDEVIDGIDWAYGNKKLVECLTKSGALDEFGHRAQILMSVDNLVAAAQQRQKARSRGQLDMFGEMTTNSIAESIASVLPQIEESEEKQLLEWEYEVLGLYLSNHPVREAIGDGIPRGFQNIATISERFDNQRVNLVALIRSVRRRTTRNNQTMAILDVEDLSGSLEVVAFPKAYQEFGHLLEADTVIAIEGRADRRGDIVQVLLDTATHRLPEVEDSAPDADDVVITVTLTGNRWKDAQLLNDLHGLMSRFEGDHPVELIVRAQGEQRTFRSRSLRVEWTSELEESIQRVGNVTSLRLRLRM